MKKILVVLFVATMTVMAGQQALAQDTGNIAVVAGASTPSPVFTPAQQEEAREALKVLGGAFGITKPQEPQPQQATNMAEVADKALDMATSALSAIAGKIEEVAPKVWEMMIRQQFAKAVGGLIVPFGIFIVFLIITIAAKNYLKKCDDDVDDGVMLIIIIAIISGIIAVIAGIVMVARIKDCIMILINPEYYAIKDLLQMLLAPGSFIQ